MSVDGELVTIGAFGFSETEAKDEASMTDPDQVETYVTTSGVDALAISVGTVHGLRPGAEVSIDVTYLASIREKTNIPLTLHGGSGIKVEVMQQAIRLPKGGASKVNLATDLELAILAVVDSQERMVNAQIEALSKTELACVQVAVEAIVYDKISHNAG